MNLFELAKNSIVNSTIIVHKYTTDFSKDYVVCEYDSHGSAIIYKGNFEAVVIDLYKKRNKFYLEVEVEGTTEHIEFNFFNQDLNVI